MTVFWVVLVVQALISAFLCMDLADKKGYSHTAWFACGFVFGILGLIAAAGLPVNPVTEQASQPLKKCPYCAEAIKGAAIVCRYCGRDLPFPAESRRPDPDKRQKTTDIQNATLPPGVYRIGTETIVVGEDDREPD